MKLHSIFLLAPPTSFKSQGHSRPSEALGFVYGLDKWIFPYCENHIGTLSRLCFLDHLPKLYLKKRGLALNCG